MPERRIIANTPIDGTPALEKLGAAWPIIDIHAYWQSIRPAPELLPGRQHFDPVAIPRLLARLRAPLYRAGYPSMIDTDAFPYMQRIYLPLARDGARMDMVIGVSIVHHRLEG